MDSYKIIFCFLTFTPMSEIPVPVLHDMSDECQDNLQCNIPNPMCALLHFTIGALLYAGRGRWG